MPDVDTAGAGSPPTAGEPPTPGDPGQTALGRWRDGCGPPMAAPCWCWWRCPARGLRRPGPGRPPGHRRGQPAIQNFPLRVLSGELLRQGHLPLWNPYIWSGSPLLGGLNAGSLYPVTLVFALLPPVAAWVRQSARRLLGGRARDVRAAPPVPAPSAGLPAGRTDLRLRRRDVGPARPPCRRAGYGVDAAVGAGPAPPVVGGPRCRPRRRRRGCGGAPGIGGAWGWGPEREKSMALGGPAGRRAWA